MVRLLPGQERLIARLFDGAADTVVHSYLQGHMGRGWADDAVKPACGRVIGGDFCFFGGDAAAPGAAELVATAAADANKSWVISIPPDESWTALIKAHTARPVRVERYAIRRDVSFDRARLQGFVDALDPAYELRRIGGGLYKAALEQDFSRDFCSNFLSAEDYVKRGLGYCALLDGEMVAGASSYTVYDEGIEVEIGTRADHRRRGLALACGARLILACLDRGLYPAWDAANTDSVALAEKLGYRLDHPYEAYILSE